MSDELHEIIGEIKPHPSGCRCDQCNVLSFIHGDHVQDCKCRSCQNPSNRISIFFVEKDDNEKWYPIIKQTAHEGK